MKTKTNTDLAFELLTDIAILSKKSAKVRRNEMSEIFASTVDYNCYKKKKRGGDGFRNITEPPENLKVAQATILNRFFYQLWFRKNYLKRFYSYDPKLGLYFSKQPREGSLHEQKDSINYFFNLFDHRMTGLLPRCSYVNHSFLHAKQNLFTNFATTIDFKDAFPSIKKEHVSNALEQVFVREIEYYAKAYNSRREFVALKKQYDAYQKKFSELAKKDRLYAELMSWCRPYLKIWSATRVGDMPNDLDEMLKQIAWHFYKPYFEKDDVVNILVQLFCYKQYLMEKAAAKLGKTTDYFDNILIKMFHKNSRYIYPLRHPLFGGRRGKYKTAWFRQMIRDEVVAGRVHCSKPKAIVKILAKQMAEVLTYNGQLPQGAPTSGFILCLIVSQQKVLDKLFYSVPNRIPKSISIYSDDIVICTGNRPSDELKKHWAEVVESAGIFKMNYKKFRTIDRRQRSPAICGLKLNRQFINGHDITPLLSIRGADRAQRLGRPFMTSSVGIPKAKQKKIRAMLHQGLFAAADDPIHAKIDGYIGYIMQVYKGRKWPKQLSNPGNKYWEKIKKPLWDIKIANNAVKHTVDSDDDY